MRVAVLCEFSGRVRDAFIRHGHDAVSYDLLPSDSDFGPHIQADIQSFPPEHYSQYDLIIAHPSCTDLAVSGARHFKEKIADGRQGRALDFVRWIMALPVEKICIENPISVISSKIRKPDQIIQPWMFGHGETKATCLWIKNLPLLVPSQIVEGRSALIHKMGPSPDRWKKRSLTYLGIAEAMADQYGEHHDSIRVS